MKGIRVDETMMTSAPDIYAAGDVAETHDIARNTWFLNAIWPCAFEQGHFAGLNMAGQKTVYPGSYRRNSIGNFIGIPAISMGVTHAESCAMTSDEDEFREIRVRTKDSLQETRPAERKDHRSDPRRPDPEGRSDVDSASESRSTSPIPSRC